MSHPAPAPGLRIRPADSADLPEIVAELTRHWGSPEIWSLGRRYSADQLPAFVAEIDGGFAGLVTYHVEDGRWQGEVVTISARTEGRGVGSALLAAAEAAIREAGCRRAFLTTTNDNIRALAFYQRRGWRLAAVRFGAIDVVRRHGVEIPLCGPSGIEIHDEIELERWLV